MESDHFGLSRGGVIACMSSTAPCAGSRTCLSDRPTHADSDDVAGAYANLQNYTQWVEYDTNVMLSVEEAVPLIIDRLADVS